MSDKLRTHGGRLFLLAVGILLTSTVGHAAARIMAAQMAQGSTSFAFELAVLLAALLAAAYVVATAGRSRLGTATVSAQESAISQPMQMQGKTDSSLLSATQITQLRLPPGVRLDSHEGIMIAGAGPDRRIVFVNPAFARLTGFEPREWIGRSGDLLLADGPLRMESLLWLDTEADGREAHWIARLHRRDGSPFCAEAHLHPVAARNGGAGHVVLVMTDVTSRLGKSRAASDPAHESAAKDAVGSFENRQSA